MNKNIQSIIVLVGMLLWGSVAGAVTWLDYQGIDRNFTGWTHSDFGQFLQPNDVEITQDGTTLGVSGNTTGLGESVYASLFSTDAFGASIDMTSYGSSGQEVVGLSMDFTGGTTSGLGFYFQAGEGASATYWFYDFLDSPGDGRYTASFSSGGWFGYDNLDWTESPLDSLGFASALTDVRSVGFFIYFNQNSDQMYGLNDFGLTIPEPETYMILGMALLSVMVVFRKRITDSLAEARAILQA